MAAQISNAANASVSLFEKLNGMIANNSLDYESWRLLILEIETSFTDDIDTISLAYDNFLSKFPLCHWHLEKYAYHKAKLSGATEAINIFERGAATSMFSIGFWVSYFTFATTCFEDPEDVRRLFGRAILCVGRDYLCHVLWDKYMKYEFNQESWSFLAQSYIEALRFPTKKTRFYYENFKQFVANLEEEIEYEMSHSIDVEQVFTPAAIKMSRNEISLVVKDLLDSSDRFLKSKALVKYRSIGEQLYQEARQLDAKIKCFEINIKRRYFSTNPLDDEQLNNWHLYLDFIEKQDNLDWAVKLFERCLIPCANHPEFWMRYVEFLGSKGGSELCLSALDHATEIFLKDVPEMHLFNARFKERMGDVNGASAALLLCDTKSDSSFLEIIAAKANMERRLGNLAAASATYEKAIKTATEKQRLHIVPSLYSHFAKFTFIRTGSADAARDVLIDGIRKVPNSRLLLEELITFAMTHEGASQVNTIDSVVGDAISPSLDEYEGLNAKDREDISRLFLEFVDLCGTVQDFVKAWSRHVKFFPRFLRLRPTYKHSTPGNNGTDMKSQKESYNLVVHDEPLKQLPESEIPINCEIYPNKVLRQHSPQKESSSEDKLGAMDVGGELASLSKENKLADNVNIQLANQSKESDLSPLVSLEISNSQENVSQELIPMSCDELPKGICADTEELAKTGDDRTKIDHMVADPDSIISSRELNKNMFMNQSGAEQKLSKQNCSPAQDRPATPPSTTSAGLLPTPVSHPQQNNQESNPHPGQTHQNADLSQMLQYYYHQQLFVQQQYQQQQQQPYFQMQQQYTTQQPYQQQQQQQQYYVQQPQQHMTSYQPTPEQLQYYGYPQHTAQGQQYQQYQQGNQNFLYQQQAQEGHLNAQEQYIHQLSAEKKQDGLSQQRTQGKDQKDPKRTPDGATRLSESPHL